MAKKSWPTGETPDAKTKTEITLQTTPDAASLVGVHDLEHELSSPDEKVENENLPLRSTTSKEKVSKYGKKWHDLNLKVKLEFRMEFKQRAARHNMSMVQLLYSAYKLWVETYDKDMPIMPGLLVSDDED